MTKFSEINSFFVFISAIIILLINALIINEKTINKNIVITKSIFIQRIENIYYDTLKESWPKNIWSYI